MQINLAKNIGFCPGVKRATGIAKKTIKKYPPPIFMLGPLVHNEEVAEDFEKQGIKIVSSLVQVPRGFVLIISAHGIGPKLEKEVLNKKIKIVDTTCPWVKRIQRLAQNFSSRGYKIIIVGDRYHREVKGINAWVKNKALIISNMAEAKKTTKKKLREKIILLSQTTQNEKKFRKIAKILKKAFPKIKILETICKTTTKRQKEVQKMAKVNDSMIIIGSKNSSNSKRLYEISKKINKKTYFIRNSKFLKRDWFKNVKQIGIASGASVPLRVIKEVKSFLKNYKTKSQ